MSDQFHDSPLDLSMPLQEKAITPPEGNSQNDTCATQKMIKWGYPLLLQSLSDSEEDNEEKIYGHPVSSQDNDLKDNPKIASQGYKCFRLKRSTLHCSKEVSSHRTWHVTSSLQDESKAQGDLKNNTAFAIEGFSTSPKAFKPWVRKGEICNYQGVALNSNEDTSRKYAKPPKSSLSGLLVTGERDAGGRKSSHNSCHMESTDRGQSEPTVLSSKVDSISSGSTTTEKSSATTEKYSAHNVYCPYLQPEWFSSRSPWLAPAHHPIPRPVPQRTLLSMDMMSPFGHQGLSWEKPLYPKYGDDDLWCRPQTDSQVRTPTYRDDCVDTTPVKRIFPVGHGQSGLRSTCEDSKLGHPYSTAETKPLSRTGHSGVSDDIAAMEIQPTASGFLFDNGRLRHRDQSQRGVYTATHLTNPLVLQPGLSYKSNHPHLKRRESTTEVYSTLNKPITTLKKAPTWLNEFKKKKSTNPSDVLKPLTKYSLLEQTNPLTSRPETTGFQNITEYTGGVDFSSFPRQCNFTHTHQVSDPTLTSDAIPITNLSLISLKKGQTKSLSDIPVPNSQFPMPLVANVRSVRSTTQQPKASDSVIKHQPLIPPENNSKSSLKYCREDGKSEAREFPHSSLQLLRESTRQDAFESRVYPDKVVHRPRDVSAPEGSLTLQVNKTTTSSSNDTRGRNTFVHPGNPRHTRNKEPVSTKGDGSEEIPIIKSEIKSPTGKRKRALSQDFGKYASGQPDNKLRKTCVSESRMSKTSTDRNTGRNSPKDIKLNTYRTVLTDGANQGSFEAAMIKQEFTKEATNSGRQLENNFKSGMKLPVKCALQSHTNDESKKASHLLMDKPNSLNHGGKEQAQNKYPEHGCLNCNIGENVLVNYTESSETCFDTQELIRKPLCGERDKQENKIGTNELTCVTGTCKERAVKLATDSYKDIKPLPAKIQCARTLELATITDCSTQSMVTVPQTASVEGSEDGQGDSQCIKTNPSMTNLYSPFYCDASVSANDPKTAFVPNHDSRCWPKAVFPTCILTTKQRNTENCDVLQSKIRTSSNSQKNVVLQSTCLLPSQVRQTQRPQRSVPASKSLSPLPSAQPAPSKSETAASSSPRLPFSVVMPVSPVTKSTKDMEFQPETINAEHTRQLSTSKPVKIPKMSSTATKCVPHTESESRKKAENDRQQSPLSKSGSKKLSSQATYRCGDCKVHCLSFSALLQHHRSGCLKELLNSTRGHTLSYVHLMALAESRPDSECSSCPQCGRAFKNRYQVFTHSQKGCYGQPVSEKQMWSLSIHDRQTEMSWREGKTEAARATETTSNAKEQSELNIKYSVKFKPSSDLPEKDDEIVDCRFIRVPLPTYDNQEKRIAIGVTAPVTENVRKKSKRRLHAKRTRVDNCCFVEETDTAILSNTRQIKTGSQLRKVLSPQTSTKDTLNTEKPNPGKSPSNLTSGPIKVIEATLRSLKSKLVEGADSDVIMKLTKTEPKIACMLDGLSPSLGRKSDKACPLIATGVNNQRPEVPSSSKDVFPCDGREGQPPTTRSSCAMTSSTSSPAVMTITNEGKQLKLPLQQTAVAFGGSRVYGRGGDVTGRTMYVLDANDKPVMLVEKVSDKQL
ncbi:uncharacterized protein LOC101856399 [Aplysia californica]|uniref:Uncharacterized protein LOC101856399 n=1 Tax=Aplysia californica TaxID=6500 RepID=A0ABM0JDJ5_APLCA|nr:uncharacterized protein LOC101856399 [Aplysia californica]